MYDIVRRSSLLEPSCPYIPSSLPGIDADPRPDAQVQPGIGTGFAPFGGHYIVMMIDVGAAS